MNGIIKQNSRKLSSGYYWQRKIIGMIVLMIFGLVFTGIGIYVLLPNDYDKNGIEATAIIQTLDGGEREYPTVKFEVNGVSYEGEILEYDSSMEVGGTIKIRYMENDPNDFAVAKGQSMFSYFPVAFGAITIMLSVFLIISYDKKSTKRIYRIKKKGKLVQCRIVDFAIGQLAESRNNITTYYTVCTVTCKDNNGNSYRQKNSAEDVAIDYLRANYGYQMGDLINVYISNKNPKKYAIDVVEYQERKAKEYYSNQNVDDVFSSGMM